LDAAKLLQEIVDTSIGLAPSPIHGVGVFALCDIPASRTDVFSSGSENWPEVSQAVVETLPQHTQKLIATYCLLDDGKVYLPPHGFKIVDLAFFLNHSDEPNLKQMEGGNYFVTLRPIHAGEELTIDYNTLTTE